MSNNGESPDDYGWVWYVVGAIVFGIITYQCSKKSAYDEAFDESYRRGMRENRYYQEQQRQRDHENMHRASEIIFGK